MSNSNSSNPKRRPVDLLFGEIEDAIPDRSLAFSEEADIAVSIPKAEAMALSEPESNAGPVSRSLEHAQVIAPGGTDLTASVLLPSASPPLSDEYRSLASTIDTLYRQMSEEASDGPRLREHCLSLLADAGSALESEEYAQAGYSTQQVKARLLRARLREKAARSFALKLIWAWEIAMGLGAAVAILLPFYAVLVPGVVPLLRAIALGALGGVLLPLRNLIHGLHNHEYAQSYNAAYWASPLKGALIGGVVFLLSESGVVATPGALGLARFFGSLSGAHLLMYLFALLAGMGNGSIFDIIRGAFVVVFSLRGRAPSTSDKAGQVSY